MTASVTNIREVAAQAGVSIGTVSRVLNGGQGVRQSTLDRVRKAAQNLQYELPERRPAHNKPAADNESWKKTGNIGLYFSNMSHGFINHPTSAAYLTGLTQCCQRFGMHPITEYAQPGKIIPDIVEQHKIDALIVKGEVTHEWLTHLKRRIPVVMINSHLHDRSFDTVNCDDHHNGFNTARYLWERGHRHIAFLGSTPKHNMHLMRLHGYEQFMRLEDAFDPQLVMIQEPQNPDDMQPKRIYPVFTDILSKWRKLPQEQRPTAIIAANDWVAAGIYRSAQQLAITIPDTLSIVSFDNTPGLCEGLIPALSSYDISLARCSDIAAQILITKLKGQWLQTEPVLQMMAGQLVQRDSVCDGPSR